MYKTDDELLSNYNKYFRLKETLEVLALQAADSGKAIEIEQLKAGNKSLQEPLAKNFNTQQQNRRGIPKVPDTNQSQLVEKSEKTKIKKRSMQSSESDRS